MGLFNLGKKSEEVKAPACACNTPVESAKKEGCCCGGQNANAETPSCDQADAGGEEGKPSPFIPVST